LAARLPIPFPHVPFPFVLGSGSQHWRGRHYTIVLSVVNCCMHTSCADVAQVLVGKGVAPRGGACRARNHEFFQFVRDFVSAGGATSWGFHRVPARHGRKAGEGKDFSENETTGRPPPTWVIVEPAGCVTIEANPDKRTGRARRARFAIPGLRRRVTQRGHRRQPTFFNKRDCSD
jgi:hypothetical protein